MGIAATAAARLLALAVVAGPQIVLQDIAPLTVAQGADSRVTSPRQVIARTAEEWRTLWSEHSTEPLPSVDFSRDTVVGVFLGSRPTAGFEVDITGAVVQGDEAVVQFVEHRPDPDAILAQVMTSPFHLVRLPVIVRAVRFQPSAAAR